MLARLLLQHEPGVSEESKQQSELRESHSYTHELPAQCHSFGHLITQLVEERHLKVFPNPASNISNLWLGLKLKSCRMRLELN